MKTQYKIKNFNDLFDMLERYSKERIKKAGKHRCVRECIGSMRRLTGKGDKPLKKPVVLVRFYQCKVCGRNMK